MEDEVQHLVTAEVNWQEGNVQWKGETHPTSDHENQMGSTGIAVSLFNLWAIWGWVVNAMPWPLYPQEKYRIPIVQVAGRAPEPAWMGAETLAPTGIPSPDCPPHSESLYWLRYPSPRSVNQTLDITIS